MLKEHAAEDMRIDDEKRSERRITSSIPCTLNFLNIRDERRRPPSEAMIVSICRRGVGLITNAQVYSGDLIEISFQVRPENPICIEGKALWCKEVSPKEFRVGVILNTTIPSDDLPVPLEK